MVGRNSERVEVINGCGAGALLNLSATGAAFLHLVLLETGTMVVLSVNDIEFKGSVVYCHRRTDGFRIGIQFLSVSPEEQMSLGRMVELFSCGVPLQFQVMIAS